LFLAFKVFSFVFVYRLAQLTENVCCNYNGNKINITKKGGYLAVNEWMKDSKGWCKLGKDGYMIVNRWTTDSKGPCYIGSEGYCVTGEQVIDGVTYRFDADGKQIA